MMMDRGWIEVLSEQRDYLDQGNSRQIHDCAKDHYENCALIGGYRFALK